MSARTRGGCRAGLLLSFSAILAAVWRSPVASAHRGYCVRQGAAFVPTAPAAPSWGGMLGRQGYGGIRRQTDVIMAAAKGNGKQGQQTEKWSLFGTKTVEKTANGKKKVVVKAKNTKAKAPVQKQKQAAAGRNAKYQRQSVQRDDSWDVERTRIPVSSVLVGGGVIAAVSTYFGQKWWTKRHAGLITDFVDDMMDAGVDKRALAKTVVQYKSKLGGPFATSRMLSEYLKVVFRAPDLSPSFVEAMDYVVNSLLRVKEQDLLTHIAQVTKEMTRQQEWVGLSILLFTFDRILPPNVAGPKLEPIRRILSKVFPGDIADHMFDLAKDAYTLEVEMMFKRMEPPLVAPSGYEVLGLREKDAQDVFKKLKDEYTPPAVATGSGSLADDLSQSLIVRKRDPIHDMIYGRAEDICDKHISGYKEGKEKKKADANRGRPPTWDETVTRISRMILTKEGEEVVSKLQNFQCQRCTRITTLMAGESEEEAFPPHYTCPTCGSGREMIIRKS